MPLYEYLCEVQGRRIEVLHKYNERYVCPCGCGATRLMSAPAKTALRWGDTQWHGRYDRGLGVTLQDENHRQAIMKERGLRQLREGEAEAEIAEVVAETKEHDDNMSRFNKHMAETGDTGLALARTFPCEEAAL